MIYIKSLDVIVTNRKEAKLILGGSFKYRKELDNGNLLFLNNIAINDTRNREIINSI